MENEEKLMTGEESLKVITAMINKTRVNVIQSSFHLAVLGVADLCLQPFRVFTLEIH